MSGGRYRLLKTDFDEVREAGAREGGRQARDSLRLGVSFMDWPGLDHAIDQGESAMLHTGVAFGDLTQHDKAHLVSTWITAYRDGYGETYYEDHRPEDERP